MLTVPQFIRTTYARVSTALMSRKAADLLLYGVFAMVTLGIPELVMAQSLPWEGGMCRAAKAMQGPWLGWVAMIAIVIAGISYGIGESNGPLKNAMQIVAGVSIAVSAGAMVQWFWPSVLTSAVGC